MKRIGIVGAAIDPDELKERGQGWELWGVNNLFHKFEDIQFSRWFEIHDIQWDGNRFIRRGRSLEHFGGLSISGYMKELNALDIPIYMQREWKSIKKSVKYPREEIEERFGNYWGCSFAWMVALAIMEDADEINFFGVALGGNEYFFQRASTEFIVGIAIGQGVKIHMDESSALLTSNYVYAFEEDFDLIYLLHGRAASDLTHTILTAIQEKLNDYFYNLQEKGKRED